MATVPQKVMRNMALTTYDPIVLAAILPKCPRKMSTNIYRAYSMVWNSHNKVRSIGSKPPKVNDVPHANSANIPLVIAPIVEVDV
jgi:hypothetical protein